MENWSPEEVMLLVQNIINATKDIKKSYKTVEGSLNWENVAVANRSVEECQATFQQVISKVRKYRTMSEILTDVMTDLKQDGFKPNSKDAVHADMPKKPMTAYLLFAKRRGKKLHGKTLAERSMILSQEWKALSYEKKEVYQQKHLRKKQEYEDAMKAFLINHPEVHVQGHSVKPQLPVPSKLFQDSKLPKILSKHPEMSHADAVKKCQNKYNTLSDKRKLRWINKAKTAYKDYLSECEEYLKRTSSGNFKPSEFHLTKEEQRILDASLGKPSLPPKNVFLYFSQLNKEHTAQLSIGEKSKTMSKLYKDLPEKDLKELEESYKQLVQSFVEQYSTYYTNLPDDERIKQETPEDYCKVYHKILKSKEKSSEAAESSKRKRKQSSSEKVVSKKAKAEEETKSDESSSESSAESCPKLMLSPSSSSGGSSKLDVSNNSSRHTEITKRSTILKSPVSNSTLTSPTSAKKKEKSK
ncbi:nucleolar transcription factor 1-like isoform X1 [Biomphalaria pfeifferi]|uniref:Nucleolar transcription factor 1-like isoform X1 n=1 Tax=Biomphalaria pfeifferi TaxID=112525 RepID=A0AAD8FJD2_BIOPF|nr:nucleolar transcription factor 1-like isoform X1 [Biomphalaria pfeifferi]